MWNVISSKMVLVYNDVTCIKLIILKYEYIFVQKRNYVSVRKYYIYIIMLNNLLFNIVLII